MNCNYRMLLKTNINQTYQRGVDDHTCCRLVMIAVLNLQFNPEILFSSLALVFVFDIIPGSAYNWTVTATSRGSNPLRRVFTFSEISPPVAPVSVIKASATVSGYQTFVFTVGNKPFVSWLIKGTPHPLTSVPGDQNFCFLRRSVQTK